MDDDADIALPEGSNPILRLPAIIFDRKWLILACMIVMTIAGVVAAVSLPIVYRSTATLLVESADLPDDVLNGGDFDIVDQRIAKFRQQVLSRPQLIELIQKHRLYTKERTESNLTQVIAEMREATRIEPVRAQIQRSARGRSSTIAFSLSFDYETADQAQSVAQDMTEQVLLLDATTSSKQAQSTVQFLTDQAQTLRAQVSDAEQQIEEIKARNGLALSNPAAFAMSGSNGSIDVQIIALQRDNSLLRAQKEARQTADERDPIVAAAEAELAAAQARYSEDHPDIAIAQRRLSEARKLAETQQARLPEDTIDQQIEANNAQIEVLQTMKSQELARLGTAQRAMALGPLVQQQIAQEQQKLDLLNEQYERVSSRLLQAQSNARAEREQKGERLSVIDPPVVPDSPISTNRFIWLLGGPMAGIALGIVLAIILDFFIRPIRDISDIRDITGDVPLVSIPSLSDPEKVSFVSRIRGLFGRGAEAGI